MKIIHYEENKTTQWSGGKTNEIYIYPEYSDFKSGDFLLRISTATVETETSVFSKLPGVKRILTVLEGNLRLIHEGHHSVKLKPYEHDSFSGDWDTSSEGKVVDFNVMTKGNSRAEVQVIKVDEDEIDIMYEGERMVLFVAEGEIAITDLILRKGDTIVCTENKKFNVKKTAVIIKVSFWP